MSDALLLPHDAVLVHIGPYKTGSTAIQSTLHLHRDELAEHGIWYPGPQARQFRESWALLGRSPRGVDQVPLEEWDALAGQVRDRADQRVCLSSESFVSLGHGKVAKLVDDLGSERVHMLVVARRLDRLLPSAWQQRIKSSHETLTFDEFVTQVVAPEQEGRAARSFWNHHGIGPILDRWTAALPPEQITVLVADEDDRSQLPRTFEALLGLPDGLLTPGPRENTSLSHDRTEFYRRLNELFDRRGWSAEDRRRLLNRGLMAGLVAADRQPFERPIPPLPAALDQRMAELSDQRADEILTSGVRVVGDPDSLRYRPPSARSAEGELPQSMAIDAAVASVEGLLDKALAEEARLRRRTRRVRRAARETPTLSGVPTRAMLRELARRGLRR